MSCTTAPEKGVVGTGIQPTLHSPKPCTLAWGCVLFLTKALCGLVEPCLKLTIEGFKNYCCITVYPLDAIVNFLIRFFNSMLCYFSYPLLPPDHPLQISFTTHAVYTNPSTQTQVAKTFNLSSIAKLNFHFRPSFQSMVEN